MSYPGLMRVLPLLACGALTSAALTGVWNGAAVAGAATAEWSGGEVMLQEPDYAREIAPILDKHCLECHGRAKSKAGLRLDQRAAALAGADFGHEPVLIAGDREASLLWELVNLDDPEERMPPGDDRDALTAGELDLIGRWIDAGMPWPDDGEAAAWPTQHWSYQVPTRPAVPQAPAEYADWVENDVDRFLLAAMLDADLTPAPPAPRGVLLRRAALDLTGLPPSYEDVQLFLSDEQPGAWERAVDRLLASPHYGEQQARRWLDLARYADSNGYEKDADRSMWPWRDWVISSFNNNLGFDRFTVEQLAGDLLPDATLAQQVATGFHRNTMTNNEGGTDPEEFRAAAVIDRVNTTGEVWLGTTMGCVQCHDHKYDPITHRDYYQMYAVFNQTADGGKGEAPMLSVPTAQQQQQTAKIDGWIAGLRAEIAADSEELRADRLAWAETVRAALSADEAGHRDYRWVDDGPPAAVTVTGDWKIWTDASAASGSIPGPAPLAGNSAVVQQGSGFVQHFFEGADRPLAIGEDDRFYVHVWLDASNPPTSLVLQFHAAGGNWEHRAFLGEDQLTWGVSGAESRLPIGELPATGSWVRVEVGAAEVGLMPGDRIDGFAFGQFDGRAWWDDAGVVSADTSVHAGVPAGVAEAVLAGEGADLNEVAMRWHREHSSFFTDQRTEIANHEKSRPKPPSTMVMSAVAEARETHILEKGSHLSPGAQVEAGVPTVLDPKRRAKAADRLEFAEWLVSKKQPLTSRVTVNRFWAWTFGAGLVTTTDDFGTQGAAPTHPELLDWLAVEFVGNGWDVKDLYRMLLTSAAYRQSSTRPLHAERDPDNRLLSWFPRRRLDGEEMRDQALALSDSLDSRIGGRPVYPPQPGGIDNATYAGDRWHTSAGGEALRRGLYTFWRRTSPYPSFLIFDAPSRELSCARRDRSNTPLQALVLLNDPNFVAAAEAFGARIAEHGSAWGFRSCTGREADTQELQLLDSLGASDGWTAVAQVLLNLDETMTRG